MTSTEIELILELENIKNGSAVFITEEELNIAIKNVISLYEKQ